MADVYTGIIEKNGQPFYPQTQANLVKTEDGRTIEAHEEDLKQEISEIKATLTPRSVSNLNDAVPQLGFGVYYALPSAANTPSVYAINLMAIKYGNYVTQIATAIGHDDMFIRNFNGSSWSAWRSFQ